MKEYIEFLDGEIARLGEESAALKKEGRQDEAHFAQIKLNIHDICRTVYRVVSRGEQGDALKAAYLQKIDALPVNWEKSLALAKSHGDHEKIAIEELKLAALARIRAEYLEMEG